MTRASPAISVGLGIWVRTTIPITAVAELASQTPEVIECHRVTGEDCYVMTAYVRDVEHLEVVIDGFAAHGQTTSSIMQSSPVRRRALAPPGAKP